MSCAHDLSPRFPVEAVDFRVRSRSRNQTHLRVRINISKLHGQRNSSRVRKGQHSLGLRATTQRSGVRWRAARRRSWPRRENCLFLRPGDPLLSLFWEIMLILRPNLRITGGEEAVSEPSKVQRWIQARVCIKAVLACLHNKTFALQSDRQASGYTSAQPSPRMICVGCNEGPSAKERGRQAMSRGRGIESEGAATKHRGNLPIPRPSLRWQPAI